ncbi:hypothetical protein TrLO_g2307 [Triparma laevis f. longispina]|uniref:SAM domain-containing protein n=1 Tax=Triparma laevis f. longispina TaxID=1714387 RepID=A0A9W7F9W9_9STRA|nr:hypothetical protein TrLO_g2307 [Triparma laevis f. longispina]
MTSTAPSPASPTSPTPSAPTHYRAKTIFQPSFNWRRLSLSSNCSPGLSNSPVTPTDVKLRNLQELTIFELLDTLKSLNCPLKARKCLQTVGVNGRDFEYYTDRDLEQIGISRPDIRERVLAIKKMISDHGCFGSLNLNSIHAKSNDRRFTTHRASTVHTLFPSKDDTLKCFSSNSPKVASGSLTPQEKKIIKEDLMDTMEKVGEQLKRMERQSLEARATILQGDPVDFSNGGDGSGGGRGRGGGGGGGGELPKL